MEQEKEIIPRESVICPECFGDMFLNREEEQYECKKCGYSMWTWVD